MDQLDALKKIFRKKLLITDNTVIIRHDGKSYNVYLDNLAIIEPVRSYKDVYDYIAKDTVEFSIEEGSKSVFDGDNEGLIKITEEEFYEWKKYNTRKINEVNERLTGKETWMNKINEDENKNKNKVEDIKNQDE